MNIISVLIILLIILLIIILIIKRNYNSKISENFNNKTVFIIPSTSKNMDYKSIESCSLFNILYNSLKKLNNISNYTFLIGVDDDDEFYNNNIELLKCTLPENFYFHSLHNFDKSYVCIVNQLANIALEKYSAEYIYLFADDLEVYDLDFIENDFIPYFKKNKDICLGWGIDQNNLQLCTHPFVSKKHVEILGYFYPPEIKNWYCDNWIQNTYNKLNVIKTKKSVIKNMIVADNKKRYDISIVKEEVLNELISNAVNKLNKEGL